MHRRTSAVRDAHQLDLPGMLPNRDEGSMRAAHRRARVSVPFEVALRHPALAICLRCCAEAHERRSR